MAKWTTDGSRGVAWCPFKKNDDFTTWNGVVDDLNEGEEAKDEVEWLKAELAQVRENERFLKSCNNGQAKLITDLRAELAKAKDEADARVAAVCDDFEKWGHGNGSPSEFDDIIAKHRPKPKFVWTAFKDTYGNTFWTCNEKHTIECVLRDDRIMWWTTCPELTTFETADLAKAEVERYLTEGER